MKKVLLLLSFCTLFALSGIVKAQVTSFPWTEDFEGTFLPTGWAKEVTTGNDITQSTTQNHTSGGTYSARFSSYSNSSDYNQYLFSEQITVDAGYTELKFWHQKYNSTETLEWGISTTTQTSGAVSTWTPVILTTSWVEEVIDLSAYIGQDIYVSWHYYGNYSYYVYLDDVSIDAAPACPSPGSLTVSNPTTSGADVGWESAESFFDIYFVVSGSTPPTPTTTPTVDDLDLSAATSPYSYTWTGGSSATEYDWYVRADCTAGGGTGQSDWVGPSTFTTIPDCGDNYYDSGGPTGDYSPNDLSTVTICPDIMGELVTIDFTVVELETCCDNLGVYDGTGTGTPLNGDLIAPAAFTSSAADGCITVTFDADGSLQYAGWEAAITCAPPPSCLEPTDLITSNPTNLGADVEWTSAESFFDIYFVIAGSAAPDLATTPTVNDLDIAGSPLPYTWMGGTTGVEYDWYVRADCGQNNIDVSSWGGPETFFAIAPPDCASNPNPTDGAMDVPAGTVTLSWDAPTTGGTPDSYDLYTGTTSGSLSLEGNYTVTTADVVFSGYNTPYFWQVVPKNSGGSATGCPEWSFTTGDIPPGVVCSDPIVVAALPYIVSDNTNAYGDDYGSADEICSSSGYMTGDDVVYSYTPAANECVDITLTNTDTWVGLFVYEGCDPFTTCINSATESGGNPSMTGVNLVGGTTYYIVISTYPSPQSTPYDLEIDVCPACPDPSVLVATNITSTSADLSWTEGGSCAAPGEYWVLPQGTPEPTPGTGTPTACPAVLPVSESGFAPDSFFDVWVLEDCGGGSTTPPILVGSFQTLPAPPDCAAGIELFCGTSVTSPDLQGQGVWNPDSVSPGACFSTPGKEVVYRFTAVNTGMHTLNVTASTGSGYIDYFYRGDGVCEEANWICIDDNLGTGTDDFGPLTAGVEYYILLDVESTTTTKVHDFQIDCPPSCPDPSGMVVSNETPVGADFVWTENGGATLWDFEVVLTTTGFTGTPTNENVTPNTGYTLMGLAASTTYDLQYRSDCDGSNGDVSGWVGPVTFTTASAAAVDWCNLQWPGTITMEVGETVDIYAQVWASGITEGPGQGADIQAWIGWSDTDTDPATWTASNWEVAAYNTLGPEAENDEYFNALGSGMAPGTYYYASRFQLNTGAYQYGGYNAGGGGFWDGTTNVSGVLTIDPLPNDECTGAIPITVQVGSSCSTQTEGTTLGATDSGTIPGCAGSVFHDVWYSVDVPASGILTIETSQATGGFTDSGMAAWEDCPGTILIECDDDDGPGTFSQIVIDDVANGTSHAGTTIYVNVWEYGGNADGIFNICARTPPACPEPSAQTATNITTTEADLGWTENGSATEWAIEYVAGADFTPGTGAEDQSTIVSVNPYSFASFSPSTEYYWYVAAVCGPMDTSLWTGPHTFTTLDPPPANDDCANAMDVTPLINAGATATGVNNSSATAGTLVPPITTGSNTFNSWGNAGNDNDTWYAVTIPAGPECFGFLSVSTLGSFDTQLAIWDDCAGTFISANDDYHGSTGGWASLTTAAVIPGNTYFIQVDGYSGATGDITLDIIYTPITGAVPHGSGTVYADFEATGADGWTHYVNSTTGHVFVSVLKNGENFGWLPMTGTFTVEVAAGATAVNLGLNSATCPGGASYTNQPDWWVMNRTWDVTPPNDPIDPVLIRTYFTDADHGDLLAAYGGTGPVNTLSHYKLLDGEENLTTNPCHQFIDPVAYVEFDDGQYVYGMCGPDHYAEYPVSGFSGGGAGAGTGNNGGLPIELLSFTGKVQDHGNVINWKTANEVNTDMFTIERSKTGEKWEDIAAVKAGGNTVTKQSYESVDANPLNRASYRLRTNDLDGSAYYSNIISLERKNSELKLNGLYPNPNIGLFTLDISSKKGTNVQIAIMNYLGVEVYSETLTGGADIQQMDVSQLSAGVYTLFVRQGYLVDSQRIVITE